MYLLKKNVFLSEHVYLLKKIVFLSENMYLLKINCIFVRKYVLTKKKCKPQTLLIRKETNRNVGYTSLWPTSKT